MAYAWRRRRRRASIARSAGLRSPRPALEQPPLPVPFDPVVPLELVPKPWSPVVVPPELPAMLAPPKVLLVPVPPVVPPVLLLPDCPPVVEFVVPAWVDVVPEVPEFPAVCDEVPVVPELLVLPVLVLPVLVLPVLDECEPVVVEAVVVALPLVPVGPVVPVLPLVPVDPVVPDPHCDAHSDAQALQRQVPTAFSSLTAVVPAVLSQEVAQAWVVHELRQLFNVLQAGSFRQAIVWVEQVPLSAVCEQVVQVFVVPVLPLLPLVAVVPVVPLPPHTPVVGTHTM